VLLAFIAVINRLGCGYYKGRMTYCQARTPGIGWGQVFIFWEQNPLRALEYANESAARKQFNKKPINNPFVLEQSLISAIA
jgi:hypothetical protein